MRGSKETAKQVKKAKRLLVEPGKCVNALTDEDEETDSSEADISGCHQLVEGDEAEEKAPTTSTAAECHDKGNGYDQGMIAYEHTFATGDCVKIISGSFTGYYATVLGQSYGDEFKLQYFKKCFRKWILNPNDLDSRPGNEFKKVVAKVDKRS